MTLDQNAIRFVFLMITSFGLAMPLHALGNRPVSVLQNRHQDTLRKAFHKSFTIGAAIPGTELNKAERRLLFANFNTVTPENCMKPAALQPAEGRFRFAKADALVEMARANGLAVNGHALLWHKQCPDWFFMENGRQAGRERVLQRLRTHIATVAGHFAGRVQSWDVLNEAIDDKDEYLRKSKWLT
ncbi:MAG: endo-1,4-beta-xylanase, partial [Chthoniobacterales bacterium]